MWLAALSLRQLFWGSNRVRLAQMAGIAMTAMIVTRIDLPLGWGTTVAVLCGAATTLVVSLLLMRR